MGYDLLVAGKCQFRIVTFPFFWLARMLARPFWWEPGSTYFSITRGRSDIIWRRDFAPASVDTHAEHRDVKQARPVRVGSAVGSEASETPKEGPRMCLPGEE